MGYMDTTTVQTQAIDFMANDGSITIEYDRLNHIPFSYHLNINAQQQTQGILRIFLIPANLRLPTHTDVTQVAIEMDRFLVFLRGREGGMQFRLYMMISKVLPNDSAMTANWERMQFTSWLWCGVRRNEGDVPDSRPMGFPLDKAPPNGNWQSLMYKNSGQKRTNHFAKTITISHDPVGTTQRY